MSAGGWNVLQSRSGPAVKRKWPHGLCLRRFWGRRGLEQTFECWCSVTVLMSPPRFWELHETQAGNSMELLGMSRARTLGSHWGKPHCREVSTEGGSSCVPVVADCSALLDRLFNVAFNKEPLLAASEHRASQALETSKPLCSCVGFTGLCHKSLLPAMYCHLLKCLASMGKEQQTGIDWKICSALYLQCLPRNGLWKWWCTWDGAACNWCKGWAVNIKYCKKYKSHIPWEF